MLLSDDLLEIFEYVNEDWARGVKVNHPKIGIFPLAFVCIIDDGVNGEMTTSTSAAINPKNPKDDMKGKNAVVLFDFAAEADEDLEMREGEGIEVLEGVDAEWGFGLNTSTGKKGIFPWKFVELVT